MHDERPDDPFEYGVASFDPGTDRILLWTRVAPGSGPLRWHLEEAVGGPGAHERSGECTPDELGCVHVDVDGLEPATTYRYWFTSGPDRSRLGRTRTLPDGSPQTWTLAFANCADRSNNELTVYRAIARTEVDLVVHLGDYIYETEGKGDHRHDPDHVCVTLEDYDRRYAQMRRDPDVLELHARHPMVAIWDDHDVADNAWRHGAKAHDPERHGPWPERLQAAAIARQRWLPARLADPEDLLRLWRSFRAGDLAELVMTDTRIDGRDQQAGDPGAPPLDDPDRSMLGSAQRRWLEERLRDRSSRWCVLTTQVTMSPMQLPVPVGTATLLDGAPSGYGIVDGRAVCVDEWDGYPAERRRVARWLADRGSDALVVSGDVHSSWVFDGHLSGGVPAAAPEFVVPAISSTPMGRQLPKGWHAVADRMAAGAEGARWFDLESWGFTVLRVTPASITGTWHSVDATSTELRQETTATWVLGRGGAQDLHPVGSPRPSVRPPARRNLAAGAAIVGAVVGAVAAAIAARSRRRASDR